MFKKCAFAALAAAGLCLSGCVYTAPVVPPVGALFTDISAPIDTDANQSPVSAKSGESSSECYLALIATGDASIHAAAANGGLTKVDHVDYKYFNVLGLYQKMTIVAYGE